MEHVPPQGLIEDVGWGRRDEWGLVDPVGEPTISGADPASTELLQITADRRGVCLVAEPSECLPHLRLSAELAIVQQGPEHALTLAPGAHDGPVGPAAKLPGAIPPMSEASTAFWTWRRFSA